MVMRGITMLSLFRSLAPPGATSRPTLPCWIEPALMFKTRSSARDLALEWPPIHMLQTMFEWMDRRVSMDIDRVRQRQTILFRIPPTTFLMSTCINIRHRWALALVPLALTAILQCTGRRVLATTKTCQTEMEATGRV